MAKENFEDILRELKGESGSDLGEKINNLLSKARGAIEKREISNENFRNFFDNLMEEEGLGEPYQNKEISTSAEHSIRCDIYNSFCKKLGVREERGFGKTYYFFDNTPLSEETKKNIKDYKEMLGKVERYVVSTPGKPDPIDFKNFVDSVLAEKKDDNTSSAYAQSSFYGDMSHRFNIQYCSDMEQLRRDINSELESLDFNQAKKKENMEDKIREVLGKSEEQTGLRVRLINVIQKTKEALEKKEMSEYNFRDLAFSLMRKEGIVPTDSKEDYSITSDFLNYFKNKLGLKGHKVIIFFGEYLFFENTTLSEEAKHQINLYKEVWSKLGEYISGTPGRPDPIKFKDFTYSLLAEKLGDNTQGFDYIRSGFYLRMCHALNVEPHTDLDNLKKDIKSKLDKL